MTTAVAPTATASHHQKCWVIGLSGSEFTPTPINKLHPLLFPPVLNKVFNFLSLWNQKKCRLVCKTWESELRPLLRLNCKINLSNLISHVCGKHHQESDEGPLFLHPICKLCNSFVIEEDPDLIRKFLHESRLPLQIKYLELRNHKWSFGQIKSILRDLPTLEELRLPITCTPEQSSPSGKDKNNGTKAKCHTNKYVSKSSNISNWRQTEANTATNNNGTDAAEIIFQKLKSLIVTFTIRDLQALDYQSISVQPILSLLQSAPHLEELYYPNIVQFTAPYDNPARVLLESIIHNDVIRLSSLKIDTYISNADLRVLTAKTLPLKSLQLTLTPDVYCRHLYDFLKGSESTLETLSLTFRDGFRLTSKFPSLSRLSTMSLIMWNGGFDCTSDIPQLKTLIVVLVEMGEEEEDYLLGDMMMSETKLEEYARASSLEELEVHANRQSKLSMAHQLIFMMPRVTLRKLTMDWVDDDLLHTIYISLPYLQELNILYGGYSEFGMTGVPPTFSRREYCDKEMYVLGLNKRRLGIGDLKRLKAVSITGDFTDFMLTFGICQIPFLQRMELSARKTCHVTDLGIKKVADWLHKSLEVVKLRNFKGISDEAVDYLTSRMNGREVYLT